MYLFFCFQIFLFLLNKGFIVMRFIVMQKLEMSLRLDVAFNFRVIKDLKETWSFEFQLNLLRDVVLPSTKLIVKSFRGSIS